MPPGCADAAWRDPRDAGSEKQDRACFRMPARIEFPERSSRVPRERGTCRGRRLKRPSVAARVRDEQQDVILFAVSPLQVELPLQRLKVLEHRFGLHGKAPAVAVDHSVPCPEVTFDRESHLGRPADASREPHSESLEQALLSGIPDRITGRVRPKPDIQPDHCRHRSQEPDVDRLRPARLEPSDRGLADATSGADRSEAQPGQSPCGSDIVDGAAKIGIDAPPSPIHGNRCSSHAEDARRRRLPAGLLRSGQHPLRGVGQLTAGRAISPPLGPKRARHPSNGPSGGPSSSWTCPQPSVGPPEATSALSAARLVPIGVSGGHCHE